MKFILVILFFNVFQCFSQKQKAKNSILDFSGTWQGILTQPGGNLDDNYAFWISIKQTKDSIHGLSRLELSNTDNFGILEFKGIINGNELTIVETKITEENLIHGAFWCIKSYVLILNSDKSLTGDWSSTKKCGPGKIYLYKSEIEFNKDKAHTNIYFSFDDIKLGVKNGKSVIGKKVVMTEIVFEEGKSELNEAAKKYLDEVHSFMKMYPKITIKFLGHTGSDGDDFPNFTISRYRAEAVANYLKEKGIPAKRLQFEGFGESRALRDNLTENGRKINTRIEFELVKE